MKELHLSILGSPLSFGKSNAFVKEFLHATTGAKFRAITGVGENILTIGINGPKPKRRPVTPIVPATAGFHGVPLGDILTISVNGPKPPKPAPVSPHRPGPDTPGGKPAAGFFTIGADPVTNKTFIRIDDDSLQTVPTVPADKFTIELENDLAQWHWRIDPTTGDLVGSAYLTDDGAGGNAVGG